MSSSQTGDTRNPQNTQAADAAKAQAAKAQSAGTTNGPRNSGPPAVPPMPPGAAASGSVSTRPDPSVGATTTAAANPVAAGMTGKTTTTPQSQGVPTEARGTTGDVTVTTREATSPPTPRATTGATASPPPTGSVHKATDDAKEAVRTAASQVQDTLADAKASTKDTANDSVKAVQDRVSDAASAVSSFGDSAGQQIDQAKQAAAQQIGQVKEQIDQAKQNATQQIDQAKQATGEQIGQAKQAADTGATQAGTQLTGFAGTLREKARTFDDNSPLTVAAAKAADALDGAGTYLQVTGPDDWVTDLKRQIERRPLAAVLIAAVIGFLLSRSTGGPRTVVINRDYPQQAPVTLPPEA